MVCGCSDIEKQVKLKSLSAMWKIWFKISKMYVLNDLNWKDGETLLQRLGLRFKYTILSVETWICKILNYNLVKCWILGVVKCRIQYWYWYTVPVYTDKIWHNKLKKYGKIKQLNISLTNGDHIDRSIRLKKNPTCCGLSPLNWTYLLAF